MATDSGRRGQRQEAEQEKPLPPLLTEFRTALREEIEAAKRTASSAAVELVSGRKVGSHAGARQYQFLVESPLNLPDDSPADLIVPGQPGRIEATIVSVSGLTVVVSVPVDLGEFVGRARMQRRGPPPAARGNHAARGGEGSTSTAQRTRIPGVRECPRRRDCRHAGARGGGVEAGAVSGEMRAW